MVVTQRFWQDAPLYIAGEPYMLIDSPDATQHEVVTVRTQAGDPGEEFERTIINAARGWGESTFEVTGGYDYAESAILHKRGRWLPGAEIEAYAPATLPNGPTSFCEYWDGTDANRRLLIISPRYVYEVRPNGTIDVNDDIGATLTTSDAQTKGVRFKNSAMASPKVFIARQGGASDYMIVRTAANTYSVSAANRVAYAIAVVKDLEGAPVLARIDYNGKLNLSLAEEDPDHTDSWAGSLYSIGESSAVVNDLMQQNRAILCGRVDGVFTFDQRLNSFPVTPGMEQTKAADNFMWFKDLQGVTIVPTAQGLIQIDGLEWGVVGPVSANRAARNLRGVEKAVAATVGDYVYAGMQFEDDAYIFLGTYRAYGDETGSGPLVWHGPIAKWPNQTITDLAVSTVYGNRLWLGADGAFASLQLEEDFSPTPNQEEGYIYLPAGILDIAGPAVITDLRKAEFIAHGSMPFSDTNMWTIEIQTDLFTWTPIDGSVVSTGIYAERFWTTETSGRRFMGVRLRYTGNLDATAELESVIVRGTVRPETTVEHVFRLQSYDGIRKPSGARVWKTAKTMQAELQALVDEGRQVVVAIGDESFQGYVRDFREAREMRGRIQAPARMFEVVIREAKLA